MVRLKCECGGERFIVSGGQSLVEISRAFIHRLGNTGGRFACCLRCGTLYVLWLKGTGTELGWHITEVHEK